MMILTTVCWIVFEVIWFFWLKKKKINLCIDCEQKYFVHIAFVVYYRDVEIGDVVTIGECRPLSKTVRFNVLKVSKGTGSKKSFKKF